MAEKISRIEEFYPAPKKQWFPSTHNYSHRQQQQQNSTMMLSPPATQVESIFVKTETERATKRGLSLLEYRARVQAVQVAKNLCPFKVGDTCVPFTEAEREKWGTMYISSICTHFDDYGDVKWENPPLILQLSPLNDRTTHISANVGWVRKNIQEVQQDAC